MVGLFLGADGLVHTVQPAAREVDMQPREHPDPAAVRCRAAKLTSFPGSGMPRHPKRDPLRDASGARRNVIAKIGRLSLRNRTLRSESHTRAERYRIVRGLASADALQATALVACAELDRIWRVACDLTDRRRHQVIFDHQSRTGRGPLAGVA